MDPSFPLCPQLQENYEILQEIGRGSFGVVYKALHRLTQIHVAIKCVLKAGITTEEQRTRFMREVSIMKLIDHPFTAQFYEMVDADDAFYIVIEYVESENLLIHITNGGPLSEPIARKYFCQLISVLDYLHNIQHIAHRDLKAENILIDKNNNIRLIDFGLSNVFTEDNPLLKTACGSPAYSAPEMVKGQRYSKAADIWSAGIVLFAMVSGNLPFYDDNVQELLHKIICTQPAYPDTLSFPLSDLLHKMLMKSPTDRITLDRVKTHPWFSQCDAKRFLQVSFATDQVYKVSTPKQLDKDIIDKVKELGVDPTIIYSDLFNREYSQATILYRILKRDKLTEVMKHINDETPESNAQADPNKAVPRAAGRSVSLCFSAARPNPPPKPKPLTNPLPKPVVPIRRVMSPMETSKPHLTGSNAIFRERSDSREVRVPPLVDA